MLKQFPTFALLGFCLAAVALGGYITADQDLLLKQKKVYELFYMKSDIDVIFPELYQLGTSYDFDVKLYTKEHIVEEFLQRYKYGTLPKGHIFSLFHTELLDEAVALFKLFFYAKDFEAFYKTAAWARFHYNEGQYTYALAVAIVHRPDTKHIRIPNIYEVYPYYFFSGEFFNHLKMGYYNQEYKQHTENDAMTLIIPANYSHWYPEYTTDYEYKLNYYTKDVGLNNFYAIGNIEFPFWMNSKEYGLKTEIRGEKYFWSNRLIYARYCVERFSNGLKDVIDFDWYKPIPLGYYPTMTYHNGMTYPQRAEWSHIPTYMTKYLKIVDDFESRIYSAIDSGFIVDSEGKFIDIYTPEGLNLLGNLIQGNADTINKDFYGMYEIYARHLLGFGPIIGDKYDFLPSALQNYATSGKDPMYWSLLKKIVGFYEYYVSKLPKYTYSELAYPEFKIETVKIDDIVTYFENFDYFIGSGSYMMPSKPKSLIFARQQRLNHKPFNYYFDIQSEKTTKAMIRVFLGPKYDSYGHIYDIKDSYKFYYPIDQWIVDLKTGSNKISRSITESSLFNEDDISSYETYTKVMAALSGQGEYKFSDKLYGFPQRFVIPKGSEGGMPFQFYFYIMPYEQSMIYTYESPIYGKEIFVKRPFGFPLDRPAYGFNFTVPNSYFQEAIIYHKGRHFHHHAIEA